MIRLQDAATLLAAVVVFGCSPVVDNSNAPDAPPDAPDLAAPVITTSNPPTMGRKVLVGQSITVSFDEPLDPASVSEATVTLGVDEVMWTYYAFDQDLIKRGGPVGLPLTNVRGTVSHDAAGHSITFKPNQPLAYGMNYTLSINVKDTYGNALDTKLPFTTFVNGVTRQISFRGGPVDKVVYFPVDANGYTDKRVRTASGSDATWFTSDDSATEHTALTFDAMGRLVDEAVMAVGDDQTLNSPDDVIAEFYSYKYDAEGKQQERMWSTAVGTDMMWGTLDDAIKYLFVYGYTDGQLSGYVAYNAPGTNGDWKAADAKCDSYWDFTYDEAGRKLRETLKKCGTDALPRNGDDTFVQVWDYSYDANGELIRTALRDGPGSDLDWLTDDDMHPMVTTLERDAEGFVTQTFTSSGPGNALTISSHTRNTYDMTTKLLVETTTFTGAGTDTDWGTGDDVVGGYTRTTYNEIGNRVDRKVYLLGPDAMPYTADDQVTLDDDFDTGN